MRRLRAVDKEADIPAAYSQGPIGDLLRFHNLGFPPREVQQAELLIGMCMDNRKSLRIPDNFAFILRAGGANLRYSEFRVSYAIREPSEWPTRMTRSYCQLIPSAAADS